MSLVDKSNCADLVRTFDWARTSLGPYAQWPERLKGYLAMVLEMPSPAIIFWGPDQIQLYNDGYSMIMGPRHPTYFGRPYRECWPDTYPVIHPWMQRVLRGEVIEVESSLFTLTRYGFIEEAYFTFTFSPLRDDSGAIAGVIQPVVEVTQEVLRSRRAQTLRELSSLRTHSDSAAEIMQALGTNPKDVPFALLYVLDDTGELSLASTVGIGGVAETLAKPSALIRASLASGSGMIVDVDRVLGREHIGPWEEPTRRAFAVPIRRSTIETPRGVVVFGVNPRVKLDDTYREFFIAIAREIATHLDEERARRAERDLQRRAETARADAEAERKRLHTIFENAPVAITILTGPRFVIEMANPLMCEIWGRRRDELLHRELLAAIPELEGQGYDQLVAQVRRTGVAYVATEQRVMLHRAPKSAAEPVYFNFVYEPLHDAAGHVSSVIVVATDVTTHVQARQAKDEFLAMLGHELRNPLAPIFTALELMRMNDDETNKRERDVIERQARHLGVLVEDLLDISRITSGKVELKLQHVELAPIIARALETASPLFEKRRQDVRIDVQAALIVDGDAARLTQVFANLLTNAAKYTEPGGRITIDAARQGPAAVVTVTDSGRGIAREMLPRVFDLFVQERQNLDRSQGGLGLGLAIVKNLVALHGGTVEARSDGPGKGSTFVVRFPAVRVSEGLQPAATASHAPMSARRPTARVLIVDDNEDAALMLAEVLAGMGFECSVAYDGPRALELAKQHAYDSVLLDIGLPAMDGYEVARHLRDMPKGRDLRIVALTGYGQFNDRQRSLEAGFDHHLVKPVDLRSLTAALNTGQS